MLHHSESKVRDTLQKSPCQHQLVAHVFYTVHYTTRNKDLHDSCNLLEQSLIKDLRITAVIKQYFRTENALHFWVKIMRSLRNLHQLQFRFQCVA